MNFYQLLIAQAEAAPGEPTSFLNGMTIPIVLSFIVMYFLMIRPKQKEFQQQQDMLKALKVDDEVVTTSGMYGKIRAIDDKVFTIEIAKDVKIKVLRSGIQGRWVDTKTNTQTPATAKGQSS